MKTKQVMGIMKVISWVIFIGLCIKAGAIMVSAFVSLFVNQEAAGDLYQGLSLSPLYDFSRGHYSAAVLLIIALLVLKAYLFYLAIKALTGISLDKPFSLNVADLISRISYVSLGTGVLAMLADAYSGWLAKGGVAFQYNWGSPEFLFMGGLIFIIALIFKRGVEIQAENELTI